MLIRTRSCGVYILVPTTIDIKNSNRVEVCEEATHRQTWCRSSEGPLVVNTTSSVGV